MAEKKPVSGALKTALKAKRKSEGVLVAKSTPPIQESSLVGFLDPFLEAMRNGSSVARFARENGINAGALLSWVHRNHRDEYEKAQREGAALLAERAVAVAESANRVEERIETTYADGSVTTAVKSFDNVQRSKIAADSLWRMAAAKDPQRFGNKAGTDESASIASEIIAARRRISNE